MKANFFAIFALVLIALMGMARADGDGAVIVGSTSGVVQGENLGSATVVQASPVITTGTPLLEFR